MAGKKPKKAPLNTVDEQARIMAAAFMEILPPEEVELSPRAVKYFDKIISELAKAEWTPHMIDIAAQLAYYMDEHETQKRLLKKEGHTLKNGKNYHYQNPRFPLIASYADRILAYRRSLSLHLIGNSTSRVKMEARNVGAKKTEQMAQAISSRLIARPKLN